MRQEVADRHPTIRETGDPAQHWFIRAGSEPNRNGRGQRAIEAEIVEVVKAALEAHVWLGPKAAQQGHLFFKPGAAGARVLAQSAILRRVPADADTEIETSA